MINFLRKSPNYSEKLFQDVSGGNWIEFHVLSGPEDTVIFKIIFPLMFVYLLLLIDYSLYWELPKYRLTHLRNDSMRKLFFHRWEIELASFTDSATQLVSKSQNLKR